MAAKQRFKTDYPGVFYIESTVPGTNKPEKIYYIMYRKAGKLVEEKAGRQFQDDMTPARASGKRSARLEGKEQSNAEKRQFEEEAKRAEQNRWTIQKLWEEYKRHKPGSKALSTDENRYELYIKEALGKKEPAELQPLDVARLKSKLLKTKSPQTVKHVLGILKRIINYGANHALCPPLPFKIQMPRVDNVKTEDLSHEQLKKLLEAIEADENKAIAAMMKMALYSGMRRGEMFKLKWQDVDFNRGFIEIVHPKGGKSQKIPMNAAARQVLEGIEKTQGSPFVFPGEDGEQRVSAQKASRRIRERAGLPKDFRPFHGLRHVFASTLASSGQVDMYVLQRLLTHKSPTMTQRYAHLRDDALRGGSDVAADIFGKVASAIEIGAKANKGK